VEVRRRDADLEIEGPKIVARGREIVSAAPKFDVKGRVILPKGEKSWPKAIFSSLEVAELW
jgi:hypothetical protein